MHQHARTYRIVLLVAAITYLSVLPAAATGNYAGDFLMLGSGARALGMGEAFVAVSDGAVSSYYNPAGLTGLDTRELNLMHSEQFGGLESYNTVSFGMPLSDRAALGVSLIHLGVGDIKYTRLWDPSQAISDSNRVEIASREDASDCALYFTGARRWGERLHLGGSIKVLRRSIGSVDAWGYGVDAGIRYDISDHWSLGTTLRDISGTTFAWDGYSDDRIAFTADTGLAYRGTMPFAGGDFILACSLALFGDTPSDKGLDTMHLGGEYLIADLVALRAGSSMGNPSFGVGLNRLPLIASSSLDYAFLSHDELDSTHRVSMSIRF